MVIRKNQFTIDFFQKLQDITFEDPKLFTDDYGTPHRND